jgi:CHAT domain-containing protein
MRPAHGPVLSFLELADGFVAWFSRDDRVVFHDLRVSGAAVATAAARFRRECSDPASAGRGFREDAELLYRWLIEPFAAEFSDQDRELTLELDGALAGIPFQAMMSPDGRYLADRFTVLLSSGYSNREVITPGPDAAVVVVANPAVIGESAARFPSLPDALKEADVVRANFRNTKVLTSHDATMEALAPLLPRAEIFHFAGHGYSDSENGALLLAANDPKTADYDLLRSADLQQQNWTRCRIAVLSACAAASGEVEGPHNPDSLVRALTRAGVPRIAASLWNVESGATTELMRCFYQSLAKGASPSEALRAAQQAVRSHPDWSHPYYWAGFELFGTT